MFSLLVASLAVVSASVCVAPTDSVLTAAIAPSFANCTEIVGNISLDPAQIDPENLELALGLVTRISGILAIRSGAPSFTSVGGLSNLEYVGGLQLLDTVADWSGLNGLSTVNGTISFGYLTSLPAWGALSLRGLETLSSLPLSDFSPLAHLNFGADSYVFIQNSPLPSLDILQTLTSATTLALLNLYGLADTDMSQLASLQRVDTMTLSNIGAVTSLAGLGLHSFHSLSIQGTSFTEFVLPHMSGPCTTISVMGTNIMSLSVTGCDTLSNLTVAGNPVLRSIRSTNQGKMYSITFENLSLLTVVDLPCVTSVTGVIYVDTAPRLADWNLCSISCVGNLIMSNVPQLSCTGMQSWRIATAASSTGGVFGCGSFYGTYCQGPGCGAQLPATPSCLNSTIHSMNTTSQCGVMIPGQGCQVGYLGVDCCDSLANQIPTGTVKGQPNLGIELTFTARDVSQYGYTYSLVLAETADVGGCSPMHFTVSPDQNGSFTNVTGLYSAINLGDCLTITDLVTEVEFQGYAVLALNYPYWGTPAYIGLWFYQLTVRLSKSTQAISVVTVTSESNVGSIGVTVSAYANLRHCHTATCNPENHDHVVRVGDVEIYQLVVYSGGLVGTTTPDLVQMLDVNFLAVGVALPTVLSSSGLNSTFQFTVPSGDRMVDARYVRVTGSTEFTQSGSRPVTAAFVPFGQTRPWTSRVLEFVVSTSSGLGRYGSVVACVVFALVSFV